MEAENKIDEENTFEFSEEEKNLAGQIIKYLRRLEQHPDGLEVPGSKGKLFPISPESYASDAKYLGEKCKELYTSIAERTDQKIFFNEWALNSTLNDEVQLVRLAKTKSRAKIEEMMNDATNHLKSDLDGLIRFIHEHLD